MKMRQLEISNPGGENRSWDTRVKDTETGIDLTTAIAEIHWSHKAGSLPLAVVQVHTHKFTVLTEGKIIPDAVDMVLFCPRCHVQHIDMFEWAETPHRSHLCHGCGTVWRPADVYTRGVDRIETHGKKDTFLP